jgi:glutaredoxin
MLLYAKRNLNKRSILMKFFSYILLPLLFLSYLIIETYLKINHSSLCHTKGCELAGTLLRFDSIYLNYMGIASAILILIFGILVIYQKNTLFKKIFFTILLTSLLFETIMIGFQFFVLPEFCKFCMGVYGFLFLILLFTAKEYMVLVLPLVGGVFIALAILTIPKQLTAIHSDGTYLIQSSSCKHCKKVKKYMHQHDISFIKIDAEKIESINFIKFMGYKTIPILLIKDGFQLHVMNGDSNIIQYYENKQKVNKDIDRVSKPSSLLDSIQNEDGCGVDLSLKLDCKK